MEAVNFVWNVYNFVHIAYGSTWDTGQVVVIGLALSHNPNAQFFFPKRVWSSLVYSYCEAFGTERTCIRT